MIIERGTDQLPILFSVPHASAEFGAWSDRTALSLEQQLKFSDYGSSETVPRLGHITIMGTHSRGVIDLNRSETADDLFRIVDFSQPSPQNVWKEEQSPDDEERTYIIEQHYRPYHRYILDVLRGKDQPFFVVDWHNTAPYRIGFDESGQAVTMPTIVLSNGDGTTCNPRLLEILANCFKEQLTQQGLPADVRMNTVFKGGYITKTYSSRNNQPWLDEQGIRTSVESLQVEYSTLLTHDRGSLTPRAGAYDVLRSVSERAFLQAFEQYRM